MRDPIDNPENEVAERIVENAIHYSRSYFADVMPALVWDMAKEIIEEVQYPLGWDDWVLDHKDELIEAIYDELYSNVNHLWEI